MKCFHLLLTLVLLSCLVVAVEASPQEAHPYLIKISRADSNVVTVLQERNIPVYLKLKKWYFAGAHAPDFIYLREKGIEYDVIDEEAWSKPYYLITRPRRGELGVIPEVGRILFQEDKEAILKKGSNQFLELVSAGYTLTRLFQRSHPILERKHSTLPSIVWEAGSDDVIETIVNNVSEDSLRSYVQRLQDFQTRYFETDSIKACARWFRNTLLDFGYTDVVFDTLTNQPLDHAIWNVIATKPGFFYPDSIVIIGGHFDSIVRDGTNPYVWAPGAGDNASGTRW